MSDPLDDKRPVQAFGLALSSGPASPDVSPQPPSVPDTPAPAQPELPVPDPAPEIPPIAPVPGQDIPPIAPPGPREIPPPSV